MDSEEQQRQPVKDRSAKLAKKRGAMPMNGQAMKRLLIDRAAQAQKEKHDKGL